MVPTIIFPKIAVRFCNKFSRILRIFIIISYIPLHTYQELVVSRSCLGVGDVSGDDDVFGVYVGIFGDDVSFRAL